MGHEGQTCCLGAVEHPLEVGVHDDVGLFLGKFQEAFHEVHAGIAEHNIKAAERVISGLDQSVYIGSDAHITFLAVAFVITEFRNDLREQIIMTCADDDLAAVPDNLSGDGTANTSGTAGHDSDFSFESVWISHDRSLSFLFCSDLFCSDFNCESLGGAIRSQIEYTL